MRRLPRPPAASARAMVWRACSKKRRRTHSPVSEAVTDSLTGLWVRRRFLEQARHTIARALAAGGRGSLLMLDLDHFKETNDQHGHPAGDAVLREVAERLRRTLRQHDLIGRYGGEEFILLLSDSNGPQAKAVAERL